jgi:hypothetical protein
MCFLDTLASALEELVMDLLFKLRRGSIHQIRNSIPFASSVCPRRVRTKYLTVIDLRNKLHRRLFRLLESSGFLRKVTTMDQGLGTTDLGIARLKDRKRAETQGFFRVIVPHSMTGKLEKVD